jgi:hypothetical protein
VLPQADAHYEAKDGQLFNVHVQGPAICSNWSGNEHGRGLVAGDKLFVAIVADCWVECGDKGGLDGAGNPAPVENKYKHLPQELQDVYNTTLTPAGGLAPGQTAMHQPVVGGNELDAAAKRRAEILKSFHLAARVPLNNPPTKATELYYSKLFGLKEMRVGRANAGGVHDYHAQTSPHLLCNFRLEYHTSSQMVETSGLKLDGEGGVALGPNGEWPKESRLGLAFSRAQLRGPAPGGAYDPAVDVWLDPDNSGDAAAARQAAAGGNAIAVANARTSCLAAVKAYTNHPGVCQTLIAAYRAAAPGNPGNAARAASIAAAVAAVPGDVIFAGAALHVPIHREDFRGPNAGAAMHEVVVGAWHVGTVLDTAASRGAGRGFATHKNDSAVNVNVDVQWWSGDRLFKHYANKPGTGQDFRMRAMPVIGRYDNRTGPEMPSAFDVKHEVGPSGAKIDAAGSMAFATFERMVDERTPVLVAATRTTLNAYPPGLTTEAQVEGEVLKTFAARSTFPDPWDLPASVPMLDNVHTADNPYNQQRTDYSAVGQQRGVWVAPDDPRSGRTEIAVLDNDPRAGVGPTGRTVMDPGNKFANDGNALLAGIGMGVAGAATRNQGNIVTF